MVEGAPAKQITADQYLLGIISAQLLILRVMARTMSPEAAKMEVQKLKDML